MGVLTTAAPVTFVLVKDREKAKAFYGGVLGLRQVAEDIFATTYDLVGMPLKLTTVEDYQPHPHTVLGWTVADIVVAVRDLKSKGVSMLVYEGFGQDENGIWSAPDGGTKLAWFNDPEGNNLCIKQG